MMHSTFGISASFCVIAEAAPRLSAIFPSKGIILRGKMPDKAYSPRPTSRGGFSGMTNLNQYRVRLNSSRHCERSEAI